MTGSAPASLLDADPSQRRADLRLLIAITLGYGLTYTCRLALGVVKKPLIDQGIYSPADLGTIGSALFYAYAFGKLFNGFVADHVNVRLFLAIGFLISAACCALLGLQMGVLAATLVWAVNGWAQSFGAPSCVVALTATFPGERRGRAYGIWSTSHSIGEGLTFLAVTAAVSAFGWRWGFWSAAMFGISAAILSWTMMRGFADRRDAVAIDRIGVLKSQLAVLAIPSIWMLGLASALAYVTRYAVNSWGILYLQEARGLSLGVAGSLLLASNIAGIFGAIAFGYVSDVMFGSRRPPANLIFALIELLGLGIVFYGPGGIIALAIGLLLFGLGMTGLVTSLGGLFATDIAPKGAAGAALGVVGVFSYVGSAVQEQISGSLIERSLTVADGVRHYDFSSATAFWIGASFLSMLSAASLWSYRGDAGRAEQNPSRL